MYFDSLFERSSFFGLPTDPESDSHHLLLDLPRDSSSSCAVDIAMLGIGERTGWYERALLSRAVGRLGLFCGDSDSVRGVHSALDDIGLLDVCESNDFVRSVTGLLRGVIALVALVG
jgi:hypothetical protein